MRNLIEKNDDFYQEIRDMDEVECIGYAVGKLLTGPLPPERKVLTVPETGADGGAGTFCYEIGFPLKEMAGSGVDIARLLSQAGEGDAAAMNLLGILQAKDPGSRTGKAAGDWFEEAAGRGYSPAMMNLVSTMSREKEPDWRRVLRYLSLSYQDGIYASAFLMGMLFLPRVGWESTAGAALIRLMERTASSDSLAARYLAYQYFHGTSSGEPDYTKALEYNLMLAEAEDPSPEHQFLCGYIYLKGLGVDADKRSALEWFSRVADNPRCPESLADLAMTYAADLNGHSPSPAEAERMKRSRRLAWLLRHDQAYTFPPEGWRDMDDLTARGFSREEIAGIVAADPKGRFELDTEGGRVRALGAHSVPVLPGVEAERVPGLLYHGTTFAALPEIAREGLDKRSRTAVCLTDDRVTAIRSGMRHGDPVVLRVDAGKMKESGVPFRKGGTHDWYVIAVPQEYLSVD